MDRIVVIGCGGAGKSTFSQQLGEALDIPVHHLDRVFWKPGWERVSREEFAQAQEEIMAQPRWIMDGNYGGTLDMRIAGADTIVFFDFPTLPCLWGAVSRCAKFYLLGRKRPDMTEGNHEKLDPEYVMWIINYRKTRRPGILRKLSEISEDKAVVILASRKQVEALVMEVSKS